MTESDARSVKAVPNSVIMDLCRTLGYEPGQVRRITLDVRQVTVEGIALRDGRPFLAGHGEIAEFMHVLPVDWDKWAKYERGAKCTAHGTERCERCHRNPSTCAKDGRSSGCSVYAETGMHWDTCPNRIRD